MSPQKTTLLLASLGAFLWGGVAFVTNVRLTTLHHAMLSGCVQWLLSFVMTYVLSLVVRFFIERSPHSTVGYAVPFFGTLIPASALYVSIHFAIETADIFKTVVGPLTMAAIFILLMTYKYRKAANEARVVKQPGNPDFPVSRSA